MVGLRDMAQADAERAPPKWLRKLLGTKFFEACPVHPAGEGRANKRTTGCNFFCTHCPDVALCSSCLSTHEGEGHQLIQIRKMSGDNVVKVDDIQHLLSVSLVQTYAYGGYRAVYLNRRPMLGQGSHSATRCEECKRGLQDEACRFCTLECKADGVEDRLDFSVSFAIDANHDYRNETRADVNLDEGSPSPNDDDDEDYEEEDSSNPSEV